MLSKERRKRIEEECYQMSLQGSVWAGVIIIVGLLLVNFFAWIFFGCFRSQNDV